MKRTLTPREKLNKLDKFSIFYSVIGGVAAVGLCIGLVAADRADKGGLELILVGLLFAYIAFIIVSAQWIVKKRDQYEAEIAEASRRIVRRGLWREIWEDYRHDGFEFCIRFDKLIYAEKNENSIDFSFSHGGHEFNLLVDEDALSIIADDETDHPKEIEKPLSSIPSLDDFYGLINSFAENICNHIGGNS